MPQGKIWIDAISCATSLFLLRDVPRRIEVGDDRTYSSLSYADCGRNFPGCDPSFACYETEDHCVISDECPFRHGWFLTPWIVNGCFDDASVVRRWWLVRGLCLSRALYSTRGAPVQPARESKPTPEAASWPLWSCKLPQAGLYWKILTDITGGKHWAENKKRRCNGRATRKLLRKLSMVTADAPFARRKRQRSVSNSP